MDLVETLCFYFFARTLRSNVSAAKITSPAATVVQHHVEAVAQGYIILLMAKLTRKIIVVVIHHTLGKALKNNSKVTKYNVVRITYISLTLSNHP